ncbi:MAG: biopolymer transporter ExbD [Prevotellaceae bacterium]|nr:biopolymer transporter ExbD [Prevotella sp.]MDD5876177.1 biopolymer transporter ExbD [Prevotellaceae bacterium]MDD7420653.1 biopolymer transporter ExbD [Prevotellaceae bacterium]
MGKVKVKKADVWIDMTPMSDVMVLLLTFFMLTSTFVKNEAVKVVTPGSVSEIKVPETNVLTILCDKEGRIFVGMDNPRKMGDLVSGMASTYSVSLTKKDMETAQGAASIGVAMDNLAAALAQGEKLNEFQADKGIPTDSVNGKMSQFQDWVQTARDNNGKDMKIAIKADEGTPYKVIKKMMSELQDMNENRYYLITSLKSSEE